MLRGLVPYLAYAYVSLVGLTTRLRVLGGEHLDAARRKNPRIIYAFWHQRQVFFTWTHRGANASVLVSKSKDGEIIAKTMELSRIHATRGSSSRGAAAAAREMLETAQAGFDLGVTPDGPRGPARKVKHGVLYLAQKLGAGIVPITNSLSHKLELKKAWDRYHVPLPFGRGVVRYGPPLFVAEGDDLAERAAELEKILDDITEQADAEA
jgi:lysophospholipid acyltransferase (LPLAT)-like uncharacterized protein